MSTILIITLIISVTAVGIVAAYAIIVATMIAWVLIEKLVSLLKIKGRRLNDAS